MNWVAFSVFITAFIVWSALHLAAAGWALRRLRSGQACEIDMNFVRIENFHAREVRGGRAKSGMRFPGDGVIKGEVCAGVVSDGSLELRDGARIFGFADSSGEMRIGSGCLVEGRATSATAIRLAAGSTANVCIAPEITTEPESGTGPGTGESMLADPSKKVELPGKIFAEKLRQLSADTWICDGDLDTQGPIVLNARLVVRGAFIAGPGSELNSDVKTEGDLTVGEDSVCRGHLISSASIRLGARCRFGSIVYAAGEIRLGEKVVGEASGPVVAYAGRKVSVAKGVIVRGKLAAGGGVVALS